MATLDERLKKALQDTTSQLGTKNTYNPSDDDDPTTDRLLLLAKAYEDAQRNRDAELYRYTNANGNRVSVASQDGTVPLTVRQNSQGTRLIFPNGATQTVAPIAPRTFEDVQSNMDMRLYENRMRSLERRMNAAQSAGERVPGRVVAENTADQMDELTRKREELQNLYEQQQAINRARVYDSLKLNPDFYGKATYRSTKTGEPDVNRRGFANTSGYADLDYELINKNPEAIKLNSVRSDFNARTITGTDKAYYETELTPEEVQTFNYLYNSQGKDAAYEYIDFIKSDLNQRAMERYTAKVQDYADKHPIASSAASILMSPVKGAAYAGQLIDLADDGKIDENAAYNRLTSTSADIRQKVSEKIANGKWGKVGSFFYNTGMSMGDFLLNGVLTGGQSEMLGLAIMGTAAAADTVRESKKRGLSDTQAFVLGTIAGAAEIVTEKVSLETLLSGDRWQRSALMNILKNVLAEGSEEGASDIINAVADFIVSRDKNQWRQDIEELMASNSGLTEKDAFKAVLTQHAIDLGLDMAGGAVSGGVMAGGQSAIDANNYAKLGKMVRFTGSESIDRLINLGMQSDNKSLQNHANRTEKRETNRNIGRLYEAYMNTPQEEAKKASQNTRQTAQEERTPPTQAIQPAETAQQETERTPTEINRTLIRDIAADPQRLADMGINPKGKAPSELRAEIRAKLEQENADILEENRIRAEQGNAAPDVTEQGETDNRLTLNAAHYNETQTAPQDGYVMPTKSGENNQQSAPQDGYVMPTRSTRNAPVQKFAPTANETDLERTGRENGATREQVEDAKRLSNITKRNMVFYSGGESENGFYDNDTGVIHINVNGRDTLTQLVSHELTHSVEDSKAYQKLSDYVFKILEKQGGQRAVNDAVNRKIEEYAETARKLGKTVKLDETGARREIVASWFAENFGNEATIRDIVLYDRTLGDKIGSFLDRILSLFSADAKERVQIEKIKKLYNKALNEVQTNGFEAETETSADQKQRIEDLNYQLRTGAITEEEYDREFRSRYSADEALTGNRQYSYDSQSDADSMGNKLSDGQKEYFKDSKVRDENGSLLAMYHGTPNGDFTVFRDGSYFTPSREYADKYRSPSASSLKAGKKETNPRTYAVYLNITKPFDIANDAEARRIYIEDYIKGGNAIGINPYLSNAEYDAIETVDWTEGEDLREFLQENGYDYDGLILDEGGTGGYGDDVKYRGNSFVTFAPEQIKNTDNLNPTSSEDIQYSFSTSESDKEYLELAKDPDGNREQLQKMVDEEAKAAGYYRKQFHQTSANNITVFDLSIGTNGGTDSETPYGVFTKRTNRDIGLGDNQLELYVNPGKTLKFKNREEIRNYFGPEYRSVLDRIDSINKEYEALYEEASTTEEEAMDNYLEEHPEIDTASMPIEEFLAGEFYDDETVQKAMQKTKSVMEEWTSKVNELSVKAKNILTNLLKKEGVDSVEILYDEGSHGRATDTFISLDNRAVKSADPVTYDDNGNVIPLSQRFNPKNDDIRYSFSMPGRSQSEYEDTYEPFKGRKIDRTLGEDEARSMGYPVLNGVQVVPLTTWVKAKDRDNYGLVTGKGAYDGTLHVVFENKHNGKRASVDLDYNLLKVVEGKYSPTTEEEESLLASIPEEVVTDDIPDEIWDAYYGPTEPLVPMEDYDREKLKGKAKHALYKAESKLSRRLRSSLNETYVIDQTPFREAAQTLSDEYMSTGEVKNGSISKAFDKAYKDTETVERDFYNNGKELRQRLKNLIITPTQEEQKSINTKSTKKEMRGTLRVANSGGISIERAYQKLNSAWPELFPDRITAPRDRLDRIYAFANTFANIEQKIANARSGKGKQQKDWMKSDFGVAVKDMLNEFRLVRRYILPTEEEAIDAPLTYEEAKKAYTDLREAHLQYAKARAKALLTPEDDQQLNRIIRGDIDIKDLDPKYNVRDITKIYEKQMAYEKAAAVVRKYKDRVRSERYKTAEGLVKDINKFHDKNIGLLYARETFDRNLEDIAPDMATADKLKETYMYPISKADADINRATNRYTQRVKALNLSQKVEKGNQHSEAYVAQLKGEALDAIAQLERSNQKNPQRDGRTLEDWRGILQEIIKSNPKMDQGKIDKAINEFRKIYDELYEQINETRIRNGYEPISYRRGYFPHFIMAEENLLSKLGFGLGIKADNASLPTTINGLTANFKPGITWFGNGLERKGINTSYDAIEGFSRYLKGALDVVYMTDSIQNLRALEHVIREKASEPEVAKRIKSLRDNPDIPDEQKDVLIREEQEKGQYRLGKFIANLNEYTNLVANKKSSRDRNMEADFGRRAYTIVKKMEQRVGANMVAANLTSSATNFIPLAQAQAQMGRAYLLRGMWQTIANYKQSDGMVERSDFLTNRKGPDTLSRSGLSKVSDIVGTPMEFIDGFTAGAIVRGRYLQNINMKDANGNRLMSDEAALREADVFARRIMGGRSKGEMPTLFNATNPITKLFTQFQLEVNNQFSEVFKDLPRNAKRTGKPFKALSLILMKYLLGSFLFNELYEALMGRRPALDPIGMLNDSVGDFTGYKLPNLAEAGIDLMLGRDVSFKTDKKSTKEAVTSTATNALEQLPFTAVLNLATKTLFDIELDGGRVAAFQWVPGKKEFGSIINSFQKGTSNRYRVQTAIDVGSKLAYIIPPVAGNQIGKTIKGIVAIAEGGSYKYDTKGNATLQYPVYTDTLGRKLRYAPTAALFGKNALPTARDWVSDEFNSLSVKLTSAYLDMIRTGDNPGGEDQKTAYEFLKGLGEIRKSDVNSQDYLRREYILKANVNDTDKAIAYYNVLCEGDKTDKDGKISKGKRTWLDEFQEMGSDMGYISKAFMTLDNIGNDKGAKERKYEYLTTLDELDGDEIKKFISYLDGEELKTDSGEDSMTQKMYDVVDSGLPFSDAVVLRTAGSADINRYLKGVDAGLPTGTALTVSTTIGELEPEKDKESVSVTQKYAAMGKLRLSKAELKGAISVIDGTELENNDGNPTMTAKMHDVVDSGLKHDKMLKLRTAGGDDIDKYLKATEAGMKADSAYELVDEWSDLKPEFGKKEVSDNQKYQMVLDTVSDSELDAAFETVMDKANFEKLKYAESFNATPRQYMSVRLAIRGSKNSDITNAINEVSMKMYIPDKVKGALWQILTGSTTTKNNPYNTEYAVRIILDRKSKGEN